MKKLIIITLAVLAMSCSSDDDNKDYSNGGLTHEKAHFLIYTKALDNQLSEVGGVVKISDKRVSTDIIPKYGIYVVNTSEGLKAFSGACAYSDSEGRGSVKYNSTNNDFECNRSPIGCGSHYHLSTGLSISGVAKEKHLRLLEYKVTPQDGDGVYLVTDK